MTSADFCPVTCQVTLKGTMNLLLQVLPIVRFSSPSKIMIDFYDKMVNEHDEIIEDYEKIEEMANQKETKETSIKKDHFLA